MPVRERGLEAVAFWLANEGSVLWGNVGLRCRKDPAVQACAGWKTGRGSTGHLLSVAQGRWAAAAFWWRLVEGVVAKRRGEDAGSTAGVPPAVPGAGKAPCVLVGGADARVMWSAAGPGPVTGGMGGDRAVAWATG